MADERRGWLRLLLWPLTPLLMTGTLAADAAREGGFGSTVVPATVPLAVAVLACWSVGLVVSVRAPREGAGWALLGLGAALAWSAFCDDYAELGRADGLDAPGWQLAATLGDSSFVWWFATLALVLQLTPPGARIGIARRLPVVTAANAVVFQLAALLRSTPLAPPREALVSPWAVPALAAPARLAAAVSIYSLALCLLASVVLLVVAWRRSGGHGRRQLLWLAVGAMPLAPAVVIGFVASSEGREDVAAVALGIATLLLVGGTGLSVLRYRLYDVEQVLTVSAAWAIASVAVLVAYAGVVVVLGRTGPPGTHAQTTTVLATLAGVAAARVSYLWGMRAVGRRVNPRRFRAVETVRAGLGGSTVDLDDLVVRALGPHSRVLYPSATGTWVTSDGHEVMPAADAVEVRRGGRQVARVEFDPREVDREVVDAVVTETAPELDNVALRAELARQLELVRESRSRLATAHLEERRRIERDLHDGAQQRLLAIAMQLRSARLNGDDRVLLAEADRAIDGLQETVRELRDLAAGLQPAALAGGGLLGAVADLAARAPLAVDFDVAEERFPPDVESAAWFVITEAVTNTVKHSGAARVVVRVVRAGGTLRVSVLDEGSGAADPEGRGLQGLADRVAAAGGSLSIVESEPHGTLVRAELPCAS